MIPTAMGPMIPARMTMLESVSASDRNVKKEMRIRIETTGMLWLEERVCIASSGWLRLTRWFLVRQKILRHVNAERTPTMLIVVDTSSRMSSIYERTVPLMKTSAAAATNGWVSVTMAGSLPSSQPTWRCTSRLSITWHSPPWYRGTGYPCQAIYNPLLRRWSHAR